MSHNNAFDQSPGEGSCITMAFFGDTRQAGLGGCISALYENDICGVFKSGFCGVSGCGLWAVFWCFSMQQGNAFWASISDLDGGGSGYTILNLRAHVIFLYDLDPTLNLLSAYLDRSLSALDSSPLGRIRANLLTRIS